MDAEYGQRYRELYERHWWWRTREEVIVETLRRFQPEGRWRSILDVGCGDGLFFDRLMAFGGEVEGLEPVAELLSHAGDQRHRIHVGPFDDTFQPGKHYSLILMLDVLEHLADPVAALRRVLSLLEPGGLFLATVPAFPVLWTSHDDVNQHYIRYTKGTFHEVAQQAGLQIAHQEYFFYWTVPAKLLVRLKEKAFPGTASRARMPPAWINATLKFVSRMERKWLPSSLPLGSSLLVVGGNHAPAHDDVS